MPGHRRQHSRQQHQQQQQQHYPHNMTRKSGHEVVTSDAKNHNAAKREAYRRERKIESYLADDENFPTFAEQLQKMGLQLRDIPADGNCLFRALGDQLEGHCRNHYRHRQDVVRFMLENKHDFEAFVEDDVPFDTHIHNLHKLGTYAGNDAIVAFARLHQVNIVIHQLNAKHLMITGCPNMKARQLHIAYHNGDHYSSVRKLNDNTESPATIRLQEEATLPPMTTGYSETGAVRAVRGCQAIEEEVIAATQCYDLKTVRDTLSDCAYDADAAIAHLMQLMELTDVDGAAGADTVSSTSSSQVTASTNGHSAWSENPKAKSGQHVHFRGDSIGGSSGYGSMTSSQGGARPKLYMAAPQPMYVKSGRRQKEIKKMEKKSRAEERHRQRILGANQPRAQPESPTFTVPRSSASITII